MVKQKPSVMLEEGAVGDDQLVEEADEYRSPSSSYNRTYGTSSLN